MKKPDMLFHTLYVYIFPWIGLCNLIVELCDFGNTSELLKYAGLYTFFIVSMGISIISLVLSFARMIIVEMGKIWSYRFVVDVIMINVFLSILNYGIECYINDYSIVRFCVFVSLYSLVSYFIYKYYKKRRFIISPQLLKTERMFECSNCGKLIDKDDKKCPKCGALFIEEVVEKSESDILIDSYNDLIKLKDLLDRDIITKEEFEKMKKKIINNK